MKYSNTALKELKKRYKNVLIKCALINMAVFIGFSATSSAETINVSSGEKYTVIKETTLSQNHNIQGGAISNHNGTVIIEDGVVFKENSAESAAGAISNVSGAGEKASVTIGNNVKFLSNTIDTYAAAILSQNANLTIGDNVEFDQNKNGRKGAAHSGGALAIDSNTGNDTPSYIVIGNNATFTKNESTKSAGALYMYESYGELSLELGSDSSFEGNKAAVNGGAIGIYGASGTTKSGVKGLSIGKNATFTQNIATSGSGGAIYLSDFNGHTASMTIDDNASFTNNTAGSTGGAVYNGGTLTFNGKTVFKGNMANGKANDIHNEGTVTFNGDVTLDGGISGSGDVTFKKGVSLTAELKKTTILASSVTFEGENTINLTVQNGLADADYDFISATSLTGEETVTIAENGLYNLSIKENGKIRVSTKSGEEIKEALGEEVSTQEADAISAMIQTNGNSTDKGNELTTLISNAIQSGDTSKAIEAIKKTAPTTAQVTQGVAKEAAGTVARLATGRMAAVKGRSGGDITEGAGLWVQALYNHTKQNATSSSDGFKADSEGLALGVDKEVSDKLTLGLGYGYMQTEVDSYGREMDVDGHNFFLYGKYQPSQWYLSSVLSYNYSKYSEKKTPMGISLRSEYDVNSYSAQMMTGYDYKNGWTPEVGLRYLVVDADSYFDGMQTVKADKDDVLTAVAGIKYETSVKAKCMTIKPHARLALTYDVISDNGTATVSVLGGGTYRAESERLHRLGAEADLGVTATVNNVDVTLEYNGAFRQDYKSQGGMLRLKYHF
ncbi:MAG: autotransporter domain-containing protein [Alphaproteobacteria bacterium]|nr:autotransporter domain-containing protein [Alphaproteobacteria bacterium]